MRISPIKSFTNPTNKSFKGYTVHDKTPYQFCEPETHRRAAMGTGRPMEKTLGSFHSNITGDVYYADPLEKVSDEIRERVDYVVYDNEPPFPDIEREVSKNYFEPMPFGSGVEGKFDDFREYFYRLEMADSKTVGEYERKIWSNIDPQDSKEKSAYFQAHVRDAKYNQETAANCLNIFLESRDLRSKKDNFYMQAYRQNQVLDFYNKEVSLAESELKHREGLDSDLNSKIKGLEERKANYTQILAQLDASNNTNKTTINNLAKIVENNKNAYDNWHWECGKTKFLSKPTTVEGYENAEKEFTQSQVAENKEKETILASIKNLDETIKSYKEKVEENKALIKKISDYANKLPEIILKEKEKAALYVKQFEQAKADLIPYFDKLKNYFNSRGIKVIR